MEIHAYLSRKDKFVSIQWFFGVIIWLCLCMKLLQFTNPSLVFGLSWFFQTCGSSSSGQDSCWSSPCGGLSCVDSDGQTRCGGEGCDGVVTAANSAWRKAQDSEQEIMNAMEEVEKLSKMVSPTGPGLGWVWFWQVLFCVVSGSEGCSHLCFFFRYQRPNSKQMRQSRAHRTSWWRPTEPNRKWTRATRNWEVSSDRSETSSHVRLHSLFNEIKHQTSPALSTLQVPQVCRVMWLSCCWFYLAAMIQQSKFVMCPQSEI